MLRRRFSLVIRSTDNGSPPMRLEKIFTISVTDVNEKPTAIQVSRVWLVKLMICKKIIIMKIPLILLAGQERQNNNSNNKLSLRGVLFGSVVSFVFT